MALSDDAPAAITVPPAAPVPSWEPPGWNGGDPLDSASFPGFTVIDIAADGSNAALPLLDTATDYYIRIGGPTRAAYTGTAPIDIRRGRNVVVIGGRIEPSLGGAYRNPLRLRAPQGTVHIEGIDFVGPNITDCIVLRNPHPLNPEYVNVKAQSPASCIVQIQNCRLHSQVVPGSPFAAGHPDLFQYQLVSDADLRGGTQPGAWFDTFPGTVRTDLVTGTCGYQGFSGGWPAGNLLLRRTNLRSFTDPGTGTTTGAAFFQYLRDTFTVTLDDFWIEPGDHGPLSAFPYAYPDLNGRTVGGQALVDRFGGGYGADKSVYAVDDVSPYREWPAAARIIGREREGLPAGGDWCPSVPGPHYASRGYG